MKNVESDYEKLATSTVSMAHLLTGAVILDFAEVNLNNNKQHLWKHLAHNVHQEELAGTPSQQANANAQGYQEAVWVKLSV